MAKIPDFEKMVESLGKNIGNLRGLHKRFLKGLRSGDTELIKMTSALAMASGGYEKGRIRAEELAALVLLIESSLARGTEAVKIAEEVASLAARMLVFGSTAMTDTLNALAEKSDAKNEKSKNLALRFALVIVGADNQLDPEERDMVEKIGRAMRIPSGEFVIQRKKEILPLKQYFFFYS